MRNKRVSPTKPELIALILSLTAATVVTYVLNSSFSETELVDWLVWVEPAPQVAVLLVFGLRASRWHDVFVYGLVAIGINLVFVISSFVFDPPEYAEMIDLYFGEAGIFWAAAVIMVAVFSFLPLMTAFSLKRLYNSFKGALAPDTR